jgi:hypothetical protein
MVNDRVKKLILEVADRQLADNNPKCTRQTLNRLMREGYSRKRSVEMIGAVIAEEIYTLSTNKETFNKERFASKLARLPELEPSKE